jgi:hypothetical protein
MCSQSLELQMVQSGLATLAGGSWRSRSVSKKPAAIAVAMAATGRTMAITGPISAHVTAMLSTPVSGVEMRKETVAPRPAPLLRNAHAAGNTLQLQRGIGAPSSAAFNTDPKPRPPRCLTSHSREIKRWIRPAANRPKTT